jgi:SAM-dependent methyltransferase
VKQSTKKAILGIPVIGQLLKTVRAVVVLPKRNIETTARLDRIEEQIQNLDKELGSVNKENSDRISALLKSTDNLSQQLAYINQSPEPKPTNRTQTSDQELFAEDHLADAFYANFEDKFRGTEEEIAGRISDDYLPLFKDSAVDFDKSPILDIGSGRGEFLKIMQKNKLSAKGIDINKDMVERSVSKGLDAIEGDATEYLLKTKPQTLGAITGFHIVEHIPFNQLLRLFTAAHTSLTEGGFVLFETPNPENIIVGSYSFYLDPSHLNPVPPDLLSFALENCGFRNIEIRRLHPSENYKDKTILLPNDLSEKIYGPRDYCVIAYK